MRRNAWMIAGTSSNSNSKSRGRTVPSLSALVCPCVWKTAFNLVERTVISNGGLGLAEPDGQSLLGRVFERLVRGENQGGGADAVVGRVNTGWRFALIRQRPGRFHQAHPCHHNAIVGRS